MAGSSRTRLEQRRIHQEIQHPAKNVNARALSVREIRATLALLFSRRWWWKTLILLLAMAAMAALGFWQLDRLEQRRAFNQQRSVALAAPPLELTGAPLPAGDLRDRQAVAYGSFDYTHQVAIRNQNYQGQPGFYLVTPLRFSGSEMAVLVNRGWIPVAAADPATWRNLDERGSGPQTGILQPTRRRPDGTVSEIPQDTVTGLVPSRHRSHRSDSALSTDAGSLAVGTRRRQRIELAPLPGGNILVSPAPSPGADCNSW